MDKVITRLVVDTEEKRTQFQEGFKSFCCFGYWCWGFAALSTDSNAS